MLQKLRFPYDDEEVCMIGEEDPTDRKLIIELDNDFGLETDA